ncbi:hypothetical protein ACFX14_000668 [Malus domestica]
MGLLLLGGQTGPHKASRDVVVLVQETAMGFCCVVPFGHSLFPSVVRCRVVLCKRLQRGFAVKCLLVTTFLGGDVDVLLASAWKNRLVAAPPCRCCLEPVPVCHLCHVGLCKRFAAGFRCVVPFDHSFPSVVRCRVVLCKKLQRGFAVKCLLVTTFLGGDVVHLDLAACRKLFAAAAPSFFQCVTFTLWGCAKDCSEFMLCSVF